MSSILDPKLKKALESDNDRALRQLMKNKPTFTIPMHTSNMRMLESDQNNRKDSIRRTIIPEMIIAVEPRNIKGDTISKYGVRYVIAQNGQAFPLAHVYSGGGSVCLGGIFVPAYIPKHSPQQPLETLFLYNDRNRHHGNTKLPVSDAQRQQIVDIVYGLDKQFPIEVHHNNWIERDTLWRIGEYMLNTYPNAHAFKIMHDVFTIIFRA